MDVKNKIKEMSPKKYTLNQDTLTYDEVDPMNPHRIAKAIIVIVISMLIGFVAGSRTMKVVIKNQNAIEPTVVTKHDMVVGSTEWKDSVFVDYQMRADLYLSRDDFAGTPLNGELIALAAENAYDSTGILLPVELCLAQCQWESGMGLKGKSPKNNPFNIGEYDSGTVMWFNNTFEGTQAYFYFMTTKYLKCRSIDELFTNFVNCDGHRYASGNYEEHVPNQYYYIKKWLNKELKKNKE